MLKQIHPTRLIFTVLGSFALIGLWQFLMASPIHSNVITVTSVPLCIYADLAVAKAVNNPTPNAGDVIVYTITVTNNGPNGATSVRLTDTLPTGVTYDSHSMSQGIYISSLWTVGNLANTTNATLTITATVDSGTCGTTITNTANGLTADQPDPNPDNNEASVTITMTGADLAVAKMVNNATPNAGDTIIYTITVTNNGPEDATSVRLTDVLPTGVTYDSHTPTQGEYDKESGLWTVDDIDCGASATLTITAMVDSGICTTTITNTANGLTADQPDPNPDNNEDNAAITVTYADLAVTKTVNNATPKAGDVITYTITVTNNGPDHTTGVQLTDTLPAGVTFGGYIATQGIYTSTIGLWTVDGIECSASATLIITATVDSDTCITTITNTAKGLTADQSDPKSDNNEASVTVTVIGADLEVAKTVNNATPNEGDIITYIITVTNNGPEDATSVRLTDVLPTGVTYDSHTPSQGTYTSSLWSVGNLASTTSATLTITATVDSGTCGTTITNTAHSLSADQPDPNPDNNEDNAAITGTCADLEVAKTVNNVTPNTGDVIVYTITVTNNGPNGATSVRLTDALPTGVTYDSHTPSQGTYTSSLWSVGNLANTTSATLTITATVDSGTCGTTITNTAHSLSADQPDPNPDNNEASAVITSTSVHCLYLPIICRNYEPTICNLYSDDFSDPNSDWPTDTTGTVRTGYSAGEYFIHRQIEGMRIVQAPASFANRYAVEVDARWDNARIGYEYGLMFGLVDFPSSAYRSYRFGVSPAKREYRLQYNAGSGWGCAGDEPYPCTWTDYTSIITDSEPDSIYHLKVECNRATVSLYINNSLLWESDDNIPSCRGQVGLFAQSSPTDPNALAYFDNFQVSCPFGASSLNIIESNMSLVSTMSIDFEFDE